MRILLVEPYRTGSHAAWAEGLARGSRHEVEILGLSGRFWKWRMYGGAVTLARRYLEGGYAPDLLLATDMLDLPTFLALARARTAGLPCAVYFHENQLTYPWSPDDRDVIGKRDRHYGFTNYRSALCADRVFFNSRYHRESFLGELGRFLRQFPDHTEADNVDRIRAKSRVLPLGIDLERLDPPPAESLDPETPPAHRRRAGEEKPLILWNHRWEYDKNPGEFFRALYRIVDLGLDFELALLGENFRNRPGEFLEARGRLGDRIVRFGPVDDVDKYADWLWQADIIPITSRQDFFGASLVEALYCHAHPILPRRLAYPELIPAGRREGLFYDTFEELVSRLAQAIKNIGRVRGGSLRPVIERFDWKRMAPVYDEALARIAAGSGMLLASKTPDPRGDRASPARRADLS